MGYLTSYTIRASNLATTRIRRASPIQI